MKQLVLDDNELAAVPVGVSGLTSLMQLSIVRQEGAAFQVPNKLALWDVMPALQSVKLTQSNNHYWNPQSVYNLRRCQLQAQRIVNRAVVFEFDVGE